MNELIQDYLKRFHILCILNYKHEEGIINLDIIDFRDIKGFYYSFMVAYNQLHVFSCENTNLIGKSSFNDLESQLSRNLKCFKTKEEWVNGKFDNTVMLKAVRELELAHKRQQSTIIQHKYNDFSILKVKNYTQPVASFIIYYTFKGIAQMPLYFVRWNKIVLKNPFKGEDAASFKVFIDSLEINDLFIWEEDYEQDTNYTRLN